MRLRFLAIILLMDFVVLSAILQSTTPSTIHPLGILLVFGLIYTLALCLLTFFLYFGSILLGHFGRRAKDRSTISLQKSYYYASVLALAPLMVVGMNSVGRTSIYDLVLVMLFEIIALFYITRRQ